MCFTEFGIMISNNEEQFSKQYDPIDETEIGISILVSEEQFLKLFSSRIVGFTNGRK
jgi:hypothetical protein